MLKDASRREFLALSAAALAHVKIVPAGCHSSFIYPREGSTRASTMKTTAIVGKRGVPRSSGNG